MGENAVFTWKNFLNQIKGIEVMDVIDMLLVTVLLYYVYAFIRDRRAGKLAVGVAVLVALMLISSLLGFSAMSFIMQNIFQVGFIALLVVFQPELRSALEKMGGEPLKSLRSIGETKETSDSAAPHVNELCHAVTALAKSKTGALIVIERSTKLGDIIKSGVPVNADLSSFVLRNIFYDGAPLHDGAVVIRGWRVHAAGCFLPLSKSETIIKDLGTRHRAGIGMSEESDAVVIIVSEETGTISLAIGGELQRGFTFVSLKRELDNLFVAPAGAKVKSRFKLATKKDGQSKV
jgi:diadenylate cyclase